MEQVCREVEVSRSGYYGWLKHTPSERSRRNQALRRRLVELHEKYPAMGLDSLYHLLKPEFGCSRKRVHRQMRLAGISSARRRAYKATTNSNHSHPIAPNLLMRNFTFQRPDQAWVGDITYIPTGEGWLYLAIVKDLCTRKIVGYAFSKRIDTQLTLAALDMAYRRRKPAKGLIFHRTGGCSMRPGPTGNDWMPMAFARACPAEETPTITPLPKTSSVDECQQVILCFILFLSFFTVQLNREGHKFLLLCETLRYKSLLTTTVKSAMWLHL